MLDELTSLGKLPILEKAIAYIAGYGGKLYIIVQNIEQITFDF
ncbi:type IV secretory system conjugative DNA transfer family protein, partial [Desulfovibrio sp. ZJ200]